MRVLALLAILGAIGTARALELDASVHAEMRKLLDLYSQVLIMLTALSSTSISTHLFMNYSWKVHSMIFP
jgi:hypothetical protein